MIYGMSYRSDYCFGKAGTCENEPKWYRIDSYNKLISLVCDSCRRDHTDQNRIFETEEDLNVYLMKEKLEE